MISERFADLKWKNGRPIVYVAHPLSAPTPEGIEANRARASRWTAWIAKRGFCPQATWIVLTGQWTEAEGRELGLELDKTLIARCDELWLVGGRISTGMQIEREEAERLGIRVQDMTGLGEEPPES